MPTTDLTLEARRDGEQSVLQIGGEIDIATAPALQEALDQILAEGQNVLILDLREVSFLDSAGLRVLVSAHRSASDQRRSVRLVCADGRVQQVFRMTNLDEVLAIYDTLAEATAADD